MEVKINMIPDLHGFLKEQTIENSWGVRRAAINTALESHCD